MGNRACIAIVDDDAGIREAVAGLVLSLGHEPRCFASADEFLTYPGRTDVDCAILDIAMPGMSGLDLQDALNEVGAPPPIIFMSACADEAALARATAGGAHCVLRKPVDDGQIVTCIEEVLA